MYSGWDAAARDAIGPGIDRGDGFLWKHGAGRPGARVPGRLVQLENAIIRRDDVADNLLPPVEVHDTLRNFLAEARKREQYWYRHFVDLILDRVWDELVEEGD
jgi:hypothetical protein